MSTSSHAMVTALIPSPKDETPSPDSSRRERRSRSSTPYERGIKRSPRRPAPTLAASRSPARASADGLLHERADPGLVGCGEPLQRERDRPHGAVVELRGVVEAEHRVALLELRRVAEEADDLAVLGVGGPPVPGLRREAGGGGLDELMKALGDGAILGRHRGDRGAHGVFAIGLARLELSGARLHRG